MDLTFCRHILPSTCKCQSPALTGRLYCHHHARLYRRGSGFHAPNLLPKRIPALELPGSLSTTPAAVQARISTILQALATGRIEAHRATACLYTLQQRTSHAPLKTKAGLSSARTTDKQKPALMKRTSTIVPAEPSPSPR